MAAEPRRRARLLRHLVPALVVLLAACNPGESDASGNAPDAPDVAAASIPPDLPAGKGFDFYVLALSWSPTYCLTGGRDRGDRTQCGHGADFDFIVHGLWPQYESGYPEYCRTRSPERVPERIGRPILDIVPSMGLIGHMWRKHGSCSGLGQADYFRVVRAARERINIPGGFEAPDRGQSLSAQAIEAAFIASNPGLEADGIAAVCSGGRLQEVRICLTDRLAYRSCREVDRSGCRAGTVSIPPPR